MTMVMALSAGLTTVFGAIAILRGSHWALEEPEAVELSSAFNKAFDTLPEKAYAQVTAITEKWLPWFALCYAIYSIVWPRIEEDSKLAQSRNYRPRASSDNGSTAGSSDTDFTNISSLGGSF